MSQHSDLLFTGAWMKDADEQLRATYDLGFAAGLEAAEKAMVEDTEEADEQRRIDDREQLRAEEAVLDTQVWEEDIGRHMR